MPISHCILLSNHLQPQWPFFPSWVRFPGNGLWERDTCSGGLWWELYQSQREVKEGRNRLGERSWTWMQLKPKPKLVLHEALELEWPFRVARAEARSQCFAAILKGKSRQHLIPTIMSAFVEQMNVSPNLRLFYVFFCPLPLCLESFISIIRSFWKLYITQKAFLWSLKLNYISI